MVGKLRVYLGMSAGVGKTYSMLMDARRDRERGVDVVIGYLEMHGRNETENLAEDFETIPRININYQEKDFQELNLDEILIRKPQVVLIDELAHTNISGARNKKRYQDVEEILRAGINVRTTLNVQHLESLVGVVKQVSGISVQETVPDSLLSGDVEIEVIDITPNQLLERLKEGKVYKGIKAPRALENFFREDNLTALREILLRVSADRVESDLLKFRSNLRNRKVWGSKERILVCVAPNAISTEVVREGYRMASSLKGELVVLSVESEKYSELDYDARKYSEEALRVARSLGAKTITRIGNDVAEEILSVSDSENISQIFLGKPPVSKFFVKKITLIDRLINQSKDIDIHLVQLTKLSNLPTKKVDLESYVYISSKDLLFALGVLTILTSTFLLFRDYIDNINFIMGYLVAVSFIAIKCNKRTAIISSFFSVLAFDFFFVPPFNTLAISDFKYAFVFITMFVVGITISLLTNRVKSHARLLHDREERTNILYGLVKVISQARSLDELRKLANIQLKNYINIEAALSYKTQNKKSSDNLDFDNLLNQDDRVVATWVYNNGKSAGYGTDTLSAARGYYLPIKFEYEIIGILTIFNNSSPLSNLQNWILESIVDTLAVCLNRLTKDIELRELNSKLDNEKMRSTFLSSISHDLRTPLSAIQGAAGLIVEANNNSSIQTKMLAETIEEESIRLSTIIRNVLDLTRVKSEGFKINSNWVEIEDIIGSAIRRLEKIIGKRKINIESEGELPLLYLDEILVEQLVINLIENSIKYAPTNSEIIISIKIMEVSDDNFNKISYDSKKLLELAVFDRIIELKDEFNSTVNNITVNNIIEQTSYGLGYEICSAIMSAHSGSFQIIKLKEGLVKSICHFPILNNLPESLDE